MPLTLAVHLAVAPLLPVAAQTAARAVPAEGGRLPSDGVRLPALGEAATDGFGITQEKRIGDEVMRGIRQDRDFLDDPLLLRYVQSLWAPLVAEAKRQGEIRDDTDPLFPYEVFLVRDRAVNAFALPGGYVGVYLGLIAMTGSADELASVLAHELSHVTQRHIARQVTGQSRDGAMALAAMLLGVVLAARTNNTDVAQAAIMGSQGAMVQGQLNFSRDMEREADRSGLRLMAQAGYSPRGMAAMFDKLAQNSRLNDDDAYPYLRSHPLTVERIGEARQRVEAMGERAGAPLAGSLLHELMRSRARARMDPSVGAQRRLQGLEAVSGRTALPWSERLVAALGAAMASTELREFEAAAREAGLVQSLLEQAPAGAMDARSQRVVQQSLAELALARGDLGVAQRAMDAADRTLTGEDAQDRPGLLLRAELALARGLPTDLARERDRLQTWLLDHRSDAAAWLMESRFAERSGQKLRAVRAQAESRAALGDLQGAIDRLQAGRRLSRQGGPGTDFIESSVIDARLRDLVAQREALRDPRDRREPRREEG